MPPALPAAAASVPSCVNVSVYDHKRYDRVIVTNGCRAGIHLKVIWAHELDSACEYISAGIGYFTMTRDFPARFDGLRRC